VLGWPSTHAVRVKMSRMLAFIGLLLVIWIVLAVLGFVIKGLLWLAFVGIILFLATAAFGWIKRRV